MFQSVVASVGLCNMGRQVSVVIGLLLNIDQVGAGVSTYICVFALFCLDMLYCLFHC